MTTSMAPDSNVRRNYKIAMDCVKKIDHITTNRKNLDTIFSSELISLRDRLRDACERLLFIDPRLYGRKAEDQIWKKCFYEPIQILRAARGKVTERQKNKALLHLTAANGYYGGYLVKLTKQLQVNVDILTPITAVMLEKNDDKNERTESTDEFAKASVYKTLLYLGDLMRYKQDFRQDEWDLKLAEHYYWQAHLVKPEHGMPFNQLGTLHGKTLYGLEAVLFYLRSSYCSEKFEGTEGNLLSTLKRCSSDYVKSSEKLDNTEENSRKRFILAFLNEICSQYEGKSFNKPVSGKESSDGGCSEVVDGLSTWVGLPWPAAADKEDNQQTTEEITDALLKVAAVQILMYDTLIGKDSRRAIDACEMLITIVCELTRATVAYLTDIRHTTQITDDVPTVECINDEEMIAEAVAEGVIGEEELANGQNGCDTPPMLLRRRRCDSEDGEEENGIYADSYPDVVELSSEEEETEDSVRRLENSLKRILNLHNGHETTEEDLMNNGSCFSDLPLASQLQYLSSVPVLQALRTIVLWLGDKLNKGGFSFGMRSGQRLASGLVDLLNLLPEEPNIDATTVTVAEDRFIRDFLPILQLEDVLEHVQKEPSAETEKQILSRIAQIRSFGHSLVDNNVGGLRFSELERQFTTANHARKNDAMSTYDKYEARKARVVVDFPAEMTKAERSDDLMKNMAKLRAQEELRRLKQVGWIPVYLVPDVGAVVDRLSLLRQLAAARKFVLVVPQSVAQVLDRSKRERTEVREAIRWLEQCAQHGSKFVRAQKSTESDLTALTNNNTAELTKDVLELVGLCANLSRAASGGSDAGPNDGAKGPTMVALLTNHPVKSLPYNALQHAVDTLGVAGVRVETVGKFWSDWCAYRKKNSG